jgi:hypothetical protein
MKTAFSYNSKTEYYFLPSHSLATYKNYYRNIRIVDVIKIDYAIDYIRIKRAIPCAHRRTKSIPRPKQKQKFGSLIELLYYLSSPDSETL